MSDMSPAPECPMLNVYGAQNKVTDPQTLANRKGRIFLEICKPKKVTRKQLAIDFAIRPSTVSAIVLQLIDCGLVIEDRPPASHQKGRPEILLRPRPERLGIIVFYVISQSIHAVLVDFLGNELGSEIQVAQAGQIDNAGLKTLLVGMAGGLRASAPRGVEIVGVSFSLPGIVDEHNKRWVFATSRWAQIRDMDLSEIAGELGLDVVVNKNLNCELRARIARRTDLENSNILCIHWGHGIGSSYSLNGTTLVNKSGGFGEIGHTYVHCSRDVLCRCGLTNCLETQAALWALLPRLQAVYPDFPCDEWGIERYLRNNAGFDTSLLRDAVRLMAEAMRNLTLVLSPNQIVLTGPFVQHPRIFDQLRREYQDLLPIEPHVFSHSNITVSAARAGPEDEIIGAASPMFARALTELCG